MVEKRVKGPPMSSTWIAERLARCSILKDSPVPLHPPAVLVGFLPRNHDRSISVVLKESGRHTLFLSLISAATAVPQRCHIEHICANF